MNPSPHLKIKLTHLERKAYVYIRQSSPAQVQHHKESQELQYGLKARAVQLGWPEVSVVVIDEDLGLSGRSTERRTGFQHLVAEVTLGSVGIVFGLDVSRLARNNRDWYHLLDLCALFDTLIADSDGVYNPADYNDRLLLGLKGTMSEAELHVMRGRLQAGLLNKARKGELVVGLPVGFYRNREGSIVKHPDVSVQQSVALAFDKFDELHSVRQVFSWYVEHGIRFPRPVQRAVIGCEEFTWECPRYTTLHHVLTNPVYAGAYFFGRYRRTLIRDPDGLPRFRSRKVPMDEWQVLIPHHHEGYISWEAFIKNQAVLRGNRRNGGMDETSRPGRGPALLQGLVRCGRCGRKMAVTYGGTEHNVPRYTCQRQPHAASEPTCQSLGSRHLDDTVVRAFLEAVAPARVAATLEAVENLNRESDTLREHWALQIEKATYEVERARRQYNEVEPENRLVARTLENRWNERLAHLADVQAQAEGACRQALELRPGEMQRLHALGADLQGVWHTSSTTHEDRKNLLRTLVEEVMVTLDRTRGEVALTVLWRGGSTTQLSTRARRRGQHRLATSEETVDVVRRLAQHLPDKTIAAVLNKQGRLTGQGSCYTAERVHSLRDYHNIPRFQAPYAAPDTYNVSQAARRLETSNATIYRWLRTGLLKGVQVTPHAPWIIHITQEDESRLRATQDGAGLSLDDLARRHGVSRASILKKIQAGELGVQRVQEGRRSRWIVDGEPLSSENISQSKLFEFNP